ncbi:MAG: cache domain-containing protein [Desulfobacterales bacterium]|nr:cache domain-containing protein [Desulfobacterales bacterium]
MKPIIKLLVFLFLFVVSSPIYAEESGNPKEVLAKVKDAVEFLSKAGESGFAEFNTDKGKWSWKDTYVFIMKCDEVALYGHPNPNLRHKDLSKLKDKNGNYFFIQLCDAAKNSKGGWIEYLWPKPGETTPSRKISYVIQVPGTPYQAGAGVYNEDVSMDELNKLIE